MRTDIASLLLEGMLHPDLAPLVAVDHLSFYQPLQDDDLEALFSLIKPWWASGPPTQSKLTLIDHLNNTTWNRSRAHMQIVQLYRQVWQAGPQPLPRSLKARLDRWLRGTPEDGACAPRWGEGPVGYRGRLNFVLIDALLRNNVMPGDTLLLLEQWVGLAVRSRSQDVVCLDMYDYVKKQQEDERLEKEEMGKLCAVLEQIIDQTLSIEQIQQGFMEAIALRRKRGLMMVYNVGM